MTDGAALGRYGEDLAARHLINLGWKVVARNWRFKKAEIDLIALDGREVVFVEVKARRSGEYGTPEEAVTEKKQAELRLGVAGFLASHPKVEAYRIDVIAIETGDAAPPKLRHYRAAVGE